MTSRHAAGVPLLVVLPLGEDPAVALRALEALAAPAEAAHVPPPQDAEAAPAAPEK